MNRFFILLLIFSIFSCRQKKATSPKYNPGAVKLTDSAINLAKAAVNIPRQQVLASAINVLNKAIGIDSADYDAYWNKRAFEMEAARYTDALATGAQMIKLNPRNADDYTCQAMLNERIMDTAAAAKCFNKALSLYGAMLDTMNVHDNKYKNLETGKALDLLMTGRRQKGLEILQKLHNDEPDVFLKNMYYQYMHISRQGIINVYTPVNYGVLKAK